MMSRRTILVVALAIGCSGRALSPGSTEDEEHDDMRPSESGAMYSECEDPFDCSPLDLCVFLAPDPGYCSALCEVPEDDCDPTPGGAAEVHCVDVGEPAVEVCALDCAAGTCPGGMVCKRVETNDGERKICF
jgi:hypothetical protein